VPIFTTVTLLLTVNAQPLSDLKKLVRRDVVSAQGLDFSIDTGSMTEKAFDRYENDIERLNFLRWRFAITEGAIERKSGFVPQLLRYRWKLKNGESLVFDQFGYFLHRSANLKTTRCYLIKRLNFMDIVLDIHDLAKNPDRN
jgi:hypothetical protein